MPVTRLRMRPWLEKQIESNEFPGLSWVNKEEMIFQIPWKHAARQGWDINKDACLFRSWAIHTGKYKEGEKETDAKTWKANFRCAMNSLPDIKEVKDKSICKGSSAVRVYKMLPVLLKTDRKERKSKPCKDGKSNVSKKIASSPQDEVEEEMVKNTDFTVDHSYTSNVYGEAEMNLDIGLMDVTNEIKEWNNQLEIQLPDSTNDLYPFQVSPINSSCDEEDQETPMSADLLNFQIFEPTSEWQQTSIDGKGFFTNESGTQSNCLTELNPVIDEVSGEIELRLCTDSKNGFEILNFLDPAFARTAALQTICSS